MCGRYTLLSNEAELKSRFHLQSTIQSYEPSYNIAPSQQVFAIIHDGVNRRAGYLQWGLVPAWAKDEKIGNNMINARSETAHEKPSFRQLMARKRCLIVADSFYEWQQRDDRKVPKRITVTDKPLFAFAGLWDKWETANKTLFTCTILTKDSNEFMSDIHHRMPIIFSNEKEEDKWIKQSFQTGKEAFQFLQTIDDVHYTAYEVSNYVNNARNNDKLCIASVANE